MSTLGGSIITTAGLNALVETGSSIVPKYFKFSSQDLSLDADLTEDDFTGWIEQDINLYQKIDDSTIEFVCDVLPDIATENTSVCGLFLEDGTLFMLAKAPNIFPSDLRQTFRIQLVYENVDAVVDFKYIDLSNTDIKFDEVREEIIVLRAEIASDIATAVSTLEIKVDNNAGDISNLGLEDVALNSRIDSLTTVVQDNKNTLDTKDIEQDTRMDNIESNSSIRITLEDNLLNGLRTDLDAEIADTDDKLRIITDDIEVLRLNSGGDTIDYTNLINGNKDLADDEFRVITENIENIEATLSSNSGTITSLETTLNNNKASLDTNINILRNDLNDEIASTNTEITTLTNNLNTNVSNLQTSIINNTNAIALLESNDGGALQTELTLLTETVITNNNKAILRNTSTREYIDTEIAIVDNKTSITETSINNLNNSLNILDTTVTDLGTLQNDNNIARIQEIASINSILSTVPSGEELTIVVSNVYKAVEDIEAHTVLIDDNTASISNIDTSKWDHARTITLSGDLSGNVSIDGSSDVTLNATFEGETLPAGGTIGQVLTNSGPGIGSWIDAPNISKVKYEQSINSNGEYSITVPDPENVIVNVMVLDPDSGSPTYNRYINAEAVSVISLTSTQVKVNNLYEMALMFKILIWS